jgi:outer membrane protein
MMLLVCGAAVLPVAAQELELTLDRAIEISLQRNPGIIASRQQVAGAKARVTQATSAYWPQVQGSTTYTRNKVANVGQAIATGTLKTEFNSYDARLTGSQYLYDFGQIPGVVKQSRETLAATREGMVTTQADVVQQVKRAYFEILKNQRLVQVSEETLASQEKHLEQARAFYDVGLRPKIDVVRAEVDVANARQNLIQARYNLRLAFVNLENILGGPPVPGPYRVVDVITRPLRPAVVELIIDEALKTRSEVSQFEAQIRAAQGQLQAAQGRHWPAVNAFGNYGYFSTDFPLENDWQAGVELTWPLFTGFRIQGEVSEAKASIQQFKAQLEQQKLQVIQEVSQAYLNLGSAEESIATAEVALRQAQENMDLADGRYRTGVGDAIEFSDAQVTLTTAKSNLVQATYNYLQAYADLERSLGRMPRN